MVLRRSASTNTMFAACALSCVAWALPAHATGDAPRIDIVGDYRYAFHAPETPDEAKHIACVEALHQAVGATAAVREQTASIVDSKMLRNLVHTLATEHVSNPQIVQQSQTGRTVYCKIKAGFSPDDVQRVLIAQTVEGGDLAVEQNRALKIVNTREDADGTVIITYQALKRLDWLGTAYPGTLRESADVMVDFYDEHGTLLRSARHPARRTTGGDDVMNPGEVGTLKVAKPAQAKTYRVWLVK